MAKGLPRSLKKAAAKGRTRSPYRASYAVNGALVAKGVALLTKATAGTYTVAAPADNPIGPEMLIISKTAAAHVITFAGGIRDGQGTLYNTATFAAQIGANIDLRFDNGVAFVRSKQNVTLSAV